MSQLILQLGIPLVLLVLGFSVGGFRERSHLRRLAAREAEYEGFPVTNLKTVVAPEGVRQAFMVTGEAVIATDYFKSIAASLRNLIGGEVRTFDSLMKRARREANLRMLDQARQAGATEVWNVRYETSNILSAQRRNRSPAVSVEVFAFGTAVIRN